MTEKINEYTATVRDMCFEDCKATPDPMLTAVKTLSYITIGVKDEKKGDDKVPVRSVIEKERAIDLFKLDQVLRRHRPRQELDAHRAEDEFPPDRAEGQRPGP